MTLEQELGENLDDAEARARTSENFDDIESFSGERCHDAQLRQSARVREGKVAAERPPVRIGKRFHTTTGIVVGILEIRSASVNSPQSDEDSRRRPCETFDENVTYLHISPRRSAHGCS